MRFSLLFSVSRVDDNAKRLAKTALCCCVFLTFASAASGSTLFGVPDAANAERQSAGVFGEYLNAIESDAIVSSTSNNGSGLWTDLLKDGTAEEEAERFNADSNAFYEDALSPDAFANVSSFSAIASNLTTEELEPGFAEREPQAVAQGYYYGAPFGASQDAIVRGSVNLPSLNSIQFWGNGYFGYGHVTPKNWDGRVLNNNSGGAFGINVPLGLATLSGYYNYHRNRSKTAGRKIQQESDGGGLVFYFNAGGFYMSALGIYGDDGYTASDLNYRYPTRFIGGRQATGFFETGYEMATLGMFVLKPFCSYQYTNAQHGRFDLNTLERLDGKKKYNSCLMTLGSHVDLNLAGLDVFTLEGRMAWITQLRKRSESIQTFCYGRVPGTMGLAQPYFQGSGAGNDAFWGGIGLRLSLFGALSVSADYDCLVNKYQTLNEGSVSLLFGF